MTGSWAESFSTIDELTSDSELSMTEEGGSLEFNVFFDFGFDMDTNDSVDDDLFGQ